MNQTINLINPTCTAKLCHSTSITDSLLRNYASIHHLLPPAMRETWTSTWINHFTKFPLIAQLTLFIFQSFIGHWKINIIPCTTTCSTTAAAASRASPSASHEFDTYRIGTYTPLLHSLPAKIPPARCSLFGWSISELLLVNTFGVKITTTSYYYPASSNWIMCQRKGGVERMDCQCFEWNCGLDCLWLSWFWWHLRKCVSNAWFV